MTQPTLLIWQAATAGRWVALILGTLMVLFLAAFVIGEGPPPIHRMTPREQVVAAGMAMLFGGLVLAWFRGVWGGVVTLLGWLLLSVQMGRTPTTYPFLIPAAAGALHLACGLVLRGTPPAGVGGPLGTTAKAAAGTVGALLLVFVLLCANEMFGQPPLMTAAGSLPPALAGVWQDGSIHLVIADDGTVSGRVDGQALEQGRVERNRSWFGRLMNWRTDYRVIGRLGGRPVSGLLDLDARGLHGSLQGRGTRSIPVHLQRRS
ncbi:MAG: hypothetical protein SFV54_14595 [Bryobacteraceae bacterium]|nr:hypothetical protein [Bryobacteraceae bacterium]